MSTLKFVGKHFLRSIGVLKNSSVVQTRHLDLNAKYKQEPDLAMITDEAEVIGRNFDDPFRTTVVINNELQVPFIVGVHRAVGGEHDYPNPGDLLCATLASCMESTTRMIANRFNIKLTKTRIKVLAVVDVRGTLRLDLDTPVAFQSMHIDFEIAAMDINKKTMSQLVKAIEKSCVIYQTLKLGLPISIDYVFSFQ